MSACACVWPYSWFEQSDGLDKNYIYIDFFSLALVLALQF